MEKYNGDDTRLVQVTPAGELCNCNASETDLLLSQYVSVNSTEHQEELSTASSDSGSYLGVPSSEQKPPVDPEKARMVASGTAGAVVGLLLGGTFFAVLAGFGSAYATQKDRPIGDGVPSSEPQQPVDPEKARIVASGTAGAVVGLLMGGTFFALLAGFGSAYATQKDGGIGDISRAMGDVALHIRDKALEIDEKHQVAENTGLALADAWEQAKELDRQHHILDKMKDFLIFSWKEAVDFTRHHQLLERGAEATGRGFEYVFKRIFGTNAVNEGEGAQTRPHTSSMDAPP